MRPTFAFSVILILDRSIYGNLIKDLTKSYLMGNYQYPQTRAKMHNTIIHWKNCATCYVLHAPPSAAVLAQDNNNDPDSG